MFPLLHFERRFIKAEDEAYCQFRLERKFCLDCSLDMDYTRGGIWKGDVLIGDLEELETMDASEIYSKRLNAKQVILPKQGEFIFPIADGRIQTSGGDQELRTSTLVRHRPIQGE